MPIYLGYSNAAKLAAIQTYCAAHDIHHVVVIAPPHAPLPVAGADHIDYAEVIMYRTFYRLLQEISNRTLIVLNECLRTQNRYDLAYNCIRNFLNQTRHQLIFQHLPQIDTRNDFMILFDFDTQSRWKRRAFDVDLILDNATVNICPVHLRFYRVDVPTSAKTQEKYRIEREKLFANLGQKDPHTLPRNLYLIGGADKLAYADTPLFGNRRLVARNQRFKCPNLSTYDNARPEDGPFTILEFPHRFIDFSDFVYVMGQSEFDVLVADLKVDHWYFNRYSEWRCRIDETYASLQS